MAERTELEMNEQRDLAYEAKEEKGSRWPGMSYEDGVIAVLDWITGNADEAPMDAD